MRGSVRKGPARAPGGGPGLGYAGRALRRGDVPCPDRLFTLPFSFSPSPSPRAAAPPEVTKVEPPSWWPGHSIDPVRLLVRGQNLAGAEVTTAGPGLETGPVTVNARGTYLFVDVAIDPKAAPGPRTIGIRTASGTAAIPLEVLAPLPRAGRFQGFSPDDAMYLVMPDRFANGDPSNDDPLVSKGLLDRSKARFYHGGDLRGVIERLPYLKDLGVTALWLNPLVRQRQPPERDARPTTGRPSPTTTATAPWTSTRSRSASATSRRCASWWIAPTPSGSR